MDTLTTVAVLAGPIVLVAYAVGSATGAWLHRAGATARPSDRLVEAFAALATATLAWTIIDEFSPGSAMSRVGLLANQTLTPWQSVAIWSGLAVVAGCVAPVFRWFQPSSDGFAPAAVVAALHFPWLLIGCAAAGGVVLAFGRRDHEAKFAMIGALLPLAWLGWVFDWAPSWGVANGPESTIWAMVLTLVLGIRWWIEHAPRQARR